MIFCIVGSLYISYDLFLQWAKSIEKYSNYETLISTGYYKTMLLEFAMLMICPYDFLRGYKWTDYNHAFDFTITYEVNDVLLFFSFIRLYLLV